MKYLIFLYPLLIPFLAMDSCESSQEEEFDSVESILEKEEFLNFLEEQRRFISPREDDASYDLHYDEIPFRFPNVTRESVYYWRDEYKRRRHSPADSSALKIRFYFFRLDSAIQRAIDRGVRVTEEEFTEHFVSPSNIMPLYYLDFEGPKYFQFYYNHPRYPNCMNDDETGRCEGILVPYDLVCSTHFVVFSADGFLLSRIEGQLFLLE